MCVCVWGGGGGGGGGVGILCCYKYPPPLSSPETLISLITDGGFQFPCFSIPFEVVVFVLLLKQPRRRS